MSPRELNLSGYRGMWLFSMFDLPVTTKRARKRYAQFRSLLLSEGFSMMQFSVYARYCASEDIAATFRRRIRTELPDDGHVRLLMVTDRQFGKMEVFHGKKTVQTEEPPAQLSLF